MRTALATLACILLALGAWAALAQSTAPQTVPLRLPGDPPAERGGRPLAPTSHPVEYDVIHARTIVLRGDDAEILLDVSGRAPGLGGRPGIVLRSATTGQRAMLFLNESGAAVVGLAAPGREHFPLAFFLNRDGGVVQIADREATRALGRQQLTRPDPPQPRPRPASTAVPWPASTRPDCTGPTCTPVWR